MLFSLSRVSQLKEFYVEAIFEEDLFLDEKEEERFISSDSGFVGLVTKRLNVEARCFR